MIYSFCFSTISYNEDVSKNIPININGTNIYDGSLKYISIIIIRETIINPKNDL